MIHHLTLIHWGRVTYICINNLCHIGSDDGLSPRQGQAIISTNAGISLIGQLETNFGKILETVNTFSFEKVHLKRSCAKWQHFCLRLNVLMSTYTKCVRSWQLMAQGMKNWLQYINPLRAKFIRRSINMYLHFMSFLHIDMTQVVEISQVRQEPTYCVWSISWVLVSWLRKVPRLQQPWYLLCWTKIKIGPAH